MACCLMAPKQELEPMLTYNQWILHHSHEDGRMKINTTTYLKKKYTFKIRATCPKSHLPQRESKLGMVENTEQLESSLLLLSSERSRLYRIFTVFAIKYTGSFAALCSVVCCGYINRPWWSITIFFVVVALAVIRLALYQGSCLEGYWQNSRH